jgi:endonuclease-3 related protein
MRSKHLRAEVHAKCRFLTCRGTGARPRYMHFSKSDPPLKGVLSPAGAFDLDLKPRDSCLSPRRQTEKENEIRAHYRVLSLAWGAQHWWPAESQFEVIVGAYLTQNTAWTNVEKALANLRAAQLLGAEEIRRVPLARLERMIRPSGYFRQKAKRLKTFVAFLDKKYDGSLDQLFAQPTDKLREELLGLNGVGPETADSILLYAGNHPVFVVDAYTRRILGRHGITAEKTGYEEIRNLFEKALAAVAHEPGQPTAEHASRIQGAAHLPSAMSTAARTPLVQIYNDMHGLIVGVGKYCCKKSKPACEACPLQPFLPAGPVLAID